MRRSQLLVVALIGVLLLWGAVSLTETWPLDSPIAAEQLDGWQVALAVVGIALFALAAAGYFRLYRRRGATFVFAVTLRPRAPRGGDGRHRLGAQLARLVVGMACAHAARFRRDRSRRPPRVARGAVQRALSRRDAGGCGDVSILFADLAGFTPFAERHSPEEVTTMLNAYFGRIIPLMEQSGGEVHQLVGDEVMVIFNKAGDQPDHAALAADAAQTLRRRRLKWRATIPTGRDSGPASTAARCSRAWSAGSRGHRKHGVVGDTVNLASRLQAEAPVGHVVLGAETVRRLPPGTIVERLPELHVKGKAEPVEAYVLRS